MSQGPGVVRMSKKTRYRNSRVSVPLTFSHQQENIYRGRRRKFRFYLGGGGGGGRGGFDAKK